MKDWTPQFCFDYRKLDSFTNRDFDLLPPLDKCIDCLSEAIVFPKIDANSGYWQVENDEWGRDIISITSHHEPSQITCLLFELQNAPHTFSRTMEVILSSLNSQFALKYQGTIVISFKSPEPQKIIYKRCDSYSKIQTQPFSLGNVEFSWIRSITWDMSYAQDG